jgi:hypothetical protein
MIGHWPRALAGWLRITGWHGSTHQRVLVVGETPKRRRIRAITRTRLAGRGRWLEPGEEALVPSTAVQIDPSATLDLISGR